MNVIFASFGNDSVALIQWVSENGNQVGSGPVIVVYNNTGWAAPEWDERVKQGRRLVKRLGFSFAMTESMGFVALAKWKQAFPMNGMQFCTEHLKSIPSMLWLDEVDPEKEATCFVGVRREESARRSTYPEWVEESAQHGERSVFAPLVRHLEADRNELLARAGFDVLPHRSQECYPCINANRNDLRQVSEERIRFIENLEEEMGVGPVSGNPKTMFRPGAHQGAVGIRNVMKWANDGKYIKGQEDLFGSGCDGGFCE